MMYIDGTTDARVVVIRTIRYCEEILSSKKRFTQNFINEMRNNLIYYVGVERVADKYFLTFQNREYKELGDECGYAYTWGTPPCAPWIDKYTRYWIAGPLPVGWKPTKSTKHTHPGYLFCGHQPYYDRRDMRNYLDCLYELLEVLNSLAEARGWYTLDAKSSPKTLSIAL